MARSDVPSLEALSAAYLFSQGKTQEEIATLLSVRQPQVSRLLKQVKHKYLRVHRQFIWDEYAESKRREIESKIFPHELGAKLRKFAANHGQQAPIVHSVEIPPATAGSEAIEAFTRLAAEIVKDLLLGVKGRVGVTWGNTIWYLSQALRSMPAREPWRPHDPVPFVPLCGDTVMDSVEHYADRTSSRIASDLSKLVNGEEPRPPWLGLVPAFIPRKTQKARRNRESSSKRAGSQRGLVPRERDDLAVRRMIARVPQYSRIFGPGGKPLADDLHMIVTASGSARSLVGIGQGLLELTSREADVLTRSILGDIGGVLIPSVGPAANSPRHADADSLVREVEDHWTGLRMKHLRLCANQAFAAGDLRGSRPGVMLLSFGPERAGIVLQAVKHGLVNHVILSSDLEMAIEKKLDAGQ